MTSITASITAWVSVIRGEQPSRRFWDTLTRCPASDWGLAPWELRLPIEQWEDLLN